MTIQRTMVRTYMPDIKPADLEALRKDAPFLLRADVPKNSRMVGAAAMPSVIDMMGFSGAGGPPTFSYMVDPHQEETEPVLFLTASPEVPFYLPSEELDVSLTPMGMIQCMGMLLLALELRGAGIPDVTDGFRAAGAHIFDTKHYVIPDVVKGLAQHKVAQAHTQKK